MIRPTPILIALLFWSNAARADRITTEDGTTLVGQVSFHNNGIVRLLAEEVPRELPLATIQFLLILPPPPPPEPEPSTLTLLATQITNRYVAIPGPGVLTWDGSFIATAISRIDDTQITPRNPRHDLLLTRINTAAIFFQPLSHHHVDRLRRATQGVLLRNGDFVEGRIVSLEGAAIRMVSLLFGGRRYSTDDAVALLFRAPTTAPATYTLQTRDGSRFLLPELVIEGNSLVLDNSPFHHYRVPLEQTVEFARRPGTNLLQTLWARLDAATDSQRRELLERIEIPDLAREAAEANLVRARNLWDDARRVWTNKSREHNEAKTAHASASKTAEASQRQAESAKRQLEKSEQDLETRTAKHREAGEVLRSRTEALARIKDDDQARDQAGRRIQEATRSLESASRSLSQAKSRLSRAREKHETALKNASKAATNAAQLATLQAEAEKELDRARKQTDAAKEAFDQAMARVL